ncbi:MAG: helix-turn-helix domain-containing protein [Clostridiales bacterium]|nr:helix-turn-helix domain-containing protein [Clostridiales bacterium]
MKIGMIIKRMREVRGLTQQDLGEAVGFPARNAATRIAQYETDYRIPKKDMADKLSGALGISPFALSEPSFEAYDSLFQALVVLEDMHGAKASIVDGRPVVTFGAKPQDQKAVNDFLARWNEMRKSYDEGGITKDEYDEWRYGYPVMEAGLQKARRRAGRDLPTKSDSTIIVPSPHKKTL